MAKQFLFMLLLMTHQSHAQQVHVKKVFNGPVENGTPALIEIYDTSGKLIERKSKRDFKDITHYLDYAADADSYYFYYNSVLCKTITISVNGYDTKYHPLDYDTLTEFHFYTYDKKNRLLEKKMVLTGGRSTTDTIIRRFSYQDSLNIIIKKEELFLHSSNHRDILSDNGEILGDSVIRKWDAPILVGVDWYDSTGKLFKRFNPNTGISSFYVYNKKGKVKLWTEGLTTIKYSYSNENEMQYHYENGQANTNFITKKKFNNKHQLLQEKSTWKPGGVKKFIDDIISYTYNKNGDIILITKLHYDYFKKVRNYAESQSYNYNYY